MFTFDGFLMISASLNPTHPPSLRLLTPSLITDQNDFIVDFYPLVFHNCTKLTNICPTMKISSSDFDLQIYIVQVKSFKKNK